MPISTDKIVVPMLPPALHSFTLKGGAEVTVTRDANEEVRVYLTKPGGSGEKEFIIVKDEGEAHLHIGNIRDGKFLTREEAEFFDLHGHLPVEDGAEFFDLHGDHGPLPVEEEDE